MRYLSVRNWSVYQHYKDRRPIWIKLHVALLDDDEFAGLSVEAKALYPQVLLVAANRDNKIPADSGWLATETRIAHRPVKKAMAELLDHGYLVDWQPSEGRKWPSRYVSPDDRQAVLEAADFKCSVCEAEEHLEIDHIIPVSQGGTGELRNLQVLCRSCNRRKRMRSVDLRSNGVRPEVETETQSSSNSSRTTEDVA